MSHDRVLTEREFDNIVLVLRRELERRLNILTTSKDIIPGPDRNLSNSIFALEFFVVSPLYYIFQRHLIDWGTRANQPGVNDLKYWIDDELFGPNGGLQIRREAIEED